MTEHRFLERRRFHPRDIATRRWLRRRTPETRRDDFIAVGGEVHFLAVEGGSQPSTTVVMPHRTLTPTAAAG